MNTEKAWLSTLTSSRPAWTTTGPCRMTSPSKRPQRLHDGLQDWSEHCNERHERQEQICPKAVADARRLLKLQTTQEFSPQGRLASNPAERAIQTVRRLSNTLLESIRVGCGIEIPASHPLFVWSYAHASWLYNRFHVTPGGNTPFEVVTSRTYSGKLAPFGACLWATTSSSEELPTRSSNLAEGNLCGQVDELRPKLSFVAQRLVCDKSSPAMCR